MLDVLIIGAGPTGLTLAIDLARRGVRALVVERGAALSPGSRGKGVQPRTMEVFEDLGVLDDILAAGAPYPPTMAWRDGQPLGPQRTFEPADPAEESSSRFSGPWMVPQWRTQKILYDRLMQLGGRVVFGAEAVTVAQDASGVDVGFADGTTLRARYAVAADGGRSAVRHAVGVGMSGGPALTPSPVLVADVSVPSLSRSHWHFFEFGDWAPGFVAICPLAGTEEFQLVTSYEEGGAEVTLAGVAELVAARTHLAAADVTGLSWSSVFRPRAGLADRFRAGRVFLAGDAAHVHSPAGGQGLNTSVQDAYNLGWKLGAVLSGKAPSSLLDTYEEERRANAARMLELSTAIHRNGARRGASTRQLGLNYRESTLSEETRAEGEGLRAGDRVPELTVGGVRVLELTQGPGWTELALPEGLFLVRPDGYVGWAGTEERVGLEEYAGRVGA